MAAADVQTVVPIEVLVAVIAVVQVLSQGIVQIVMGFLGKAKSKGDDEMMLRLLAAIERLNDDRDAEAHMIRDLHEMHKVTDKDGRPIWYFPGSIGDLMKQVSESQANLARILETIVRQLEVRRPR